MADSRNPKPGTEEIIIRSTDGSTVITHKREPETDNWGGGTRIVTTTQTNGLSGHTTIHGSDDVNYHHPEGGKKTVKS